MNHWVLLRRDICVGVFEGLNGEPERPSVAPDVRRVAGNDAIELVGVAVGLQQACASAAGATRPIGIARLTTVEGFDECLSFDGHLMFGAVGEVDEFLRVTNDKTSAGISMAIICSAGRIAATECGTALGLQPDRGLALSLSSRIPSTRPRNHQFAPWRCAPARIRSGRLRSSQRRLGCRCSSRERCEETGHPPRKLVNGRAGPCALASPRSPATERKARPSVARIATRVWVAKS